MEPIIKYVHLINEIFGPDDGKLHGYPGHPEIELALLRLYTATGDSSAYDLARYFVEERGNPTGQNGKQFYDWEAEKRGDSPWKRPDAYPESGSHWYNQSHLPILEQPTIEGHSVRALYLLTAVADLLCLEKSNARHFDKSDEWLSAVNRLWNNMVDQKMYLTGGVGAIKQWEGFGIDYFLPQSTDTGGCYSETCASIAVMFLAERMLRINPDGRYGDIMELCLYNNVMTAMSLDGKAFTYVNQLASSDADKSGREDWFWCACCPPNFSRLFGSLGGYLWHFGARDQDAYINVHLYTSATLNFDADSGPIELEMKSDWPWHGEVVFALKNESRCKTNIKLRIPGWSEMKYRLEPPIEAASVANGYLSLEHDYLVANPKFKLHVDGFQPRFIEPHPYTNQSTLSLARGPLVYCLEDAYNGWEDNHFKDVVLSPSEDIKEEWQECSSSKERYVALRSTVGSQSLRSWNVREPGQDPSSKPRQDEVLSQHDALFIPYYLRANSGGKGHMRVGLIKG